MSSNPHTFAVTSILFHSISSLLLQFTMEMEDFCRAIDAPVGVYIVIHDPHDTFARPFRSLDGASFCWGASLDPPCTGYTPTMERYYNRFLQMKEEHGFKFDVNVIHWVEGSERVRGLLRHSLLVGPNYSHTADGIDRPELFKEQWEQIKVELRIKKCQVHPHLRLKLKDEKKGQAAKEKKGPPI